MPPPFDLKSRRRGEIRTIQLRYYIILTFQGAAHQPCMMEDVTPPCPVCPVCPVCILRGRVQRQDEWLSPRFSVDLPHPKSIFSTFPVLLARHFWARFSLDISTSSMGLYMCTCASFKCDIQDDAATTIALVLMSFQTHPGVAGATPEYHA